MKAAVFKAVRKIVYTTDYPTPTIGPNDALVKVQYCGICGSDVTNFREKLYQTPLIMGHEFVGELVQLGEQVRGFQLGDRVLGINVKLDVFQEKLTGLGIFINGGFAEYVRVPKEFLFHAPPDTPSPECALVESYAFAVRALKLASLPPSPKIAIIGGGSVGLTTLDLLLTQTDPSYVIVIEPHEFLREKALELGATAALPPIKRRIRKFFKTHGAPSSIFECAGTASTFHLALEFIHRGGTILLQGLFRGKLHFSPMFLNSKEICLKGVMSHERSDILIAIDLFTQKKVHPRPLISSIIELKDLQTTFEHFLTPGERTFVKILVKIS
ncbi:MAG: zinc-dependent alcohol dehydrogenase [Candidatus Helarchaeota archaeon]